MALLGFSLEEVLEIVPDFQDRVERVEAKAEATLVEIEGLKKQIEALLLTYTQTKDNMNRKLRAVKAYRGKVGSNVLNRPTK